VCCGRDVAVTLWTTLRCSDIFNGEDNDENVAVVGQDGFDEIRARDWALEALPSDTVPLCEYDASLPFIAAA
jgi:hypothetical protein